jgi:hypothetical protein
VLIVVDGDRARRRITAAAAGRDHFAAMFGLSEWIARNTILGLGEMRRRRFRYEPPPGYEREDHGLATTWTRPGATLLVLPAKPLDELATGAALEDLVGECFLDTELPREDTAQQIPILSRHGLRGEIASHHERGMWFETATLVDDRFRYRLVLHAASRAHHDTFLAAVASVRPIPERARVQVQAPFLLRV